MAGHNKWSQIKHKKAKEDAKRGKAFTKLIKEIIVSARTGGGDPAGNARLRALMDKAKEINMPQENVIRAIKKGTGELPGVEYTPIIYEGYGPEGIAILVDTLTDNKNRTVADLRHMFSKHSGNLGETGSVQWMFDYLGVVHATGTTSEEMLLEALIDHDIKDIRIDKDWISVFCDPKALDAVKEEMKKLGLSIDNADLEWVAKNRIDVSEDKEKKVLDLLTALQDHDDVQNVYATLA